MWHRYPNATPVVSDWQLSTGSVLYSKNISDVGGNIQAANMTLQSAAEKGEVELRIHGIQGFGVCTNNSDYPLRVEVRLLWIPNANDFTLNTANTYITPRFTMFCKDGQGVNGMLYRGYDKRGLGALDATGVPLKFQQLARKVIHLPARSFNGTVGTGGTAQPIEISKSLVYKRFSFAKYFKTARKGYVRASQQEMSNGNFFLVYWSDGATVLQSYSMLITTNLQYSLKAPMNDNKAL